MSNRTCQRPAPIAMKSMSLVCTFAASRPRVTALVAVNSGDGPAAASLGVAGNAAAKMLRRLFVREKLPIVGLAAGRGLGGGAGASLGASPEGTVWKTTLLETLAAPLGPDPIAVGGGERRTDPRGREAGPPLPPVVAALSVPWTMQVPAVACVPAIADGAVSGSAGGTAPASTAAISCSTAFAS